MSWPPPNPHPADHCICLFGYMLDELDAVEESTAPSPGVTIIEVVGSIPGRYILLAVSGLSFPV